MLFLAKLAFVSLYLLQSVGVMGQLILPQTNNACRPCTKSKNQEVSCLDIFLKPFSRIPATSKHQP